MVVPVDPAFSAMAVASPLFTDLKYNLCGGERVFVQIRFPWCAGFGFV
jgi:hypothetical protein